MSSPEAFVWMALHFYQSLLEPVWPRRSRTACTRAHLRRLDVGHSGQRSTGLLPHSLSIIFTVYFFVFLLYICFSSDGCVHLIFRRPWQYQVAIQILQVVCCSIDYQVIIDFMWRQWLKKPLKTNCRWSVVSKVELLKWPFDKLTDTLYDVCVQSRINTESIPKTKDLYTISCISLAMQRALVFL